MKGLNPLNALQNSRVDQGRKYDWPLSIFLGLGLDDVGCVVGLLQTVDKGDSPKPKPQAIELGQDRRSEGLGRDSRAVGDKEHGTPCGDDRVWSGLIGKARGHRARD